MSRIETVFLFDLDGTLIDSVYQHVLAWREALDQEGIDLSVWRIHRRIGMSGGLFTNMLLRETGLEISPELVERLRRRHAEAYTRHCHQVRPLPGARELLKYLTENESPWAVATSGRMETAKLNLDALGIDRAHMAGTSTGGCVLSRYPVVSGLPSIWQGSTGSIPPVPGYCCEPNTI